MSSSKKVETRQEIDTLGPMEVPMDRYYGAQTMRCLLNFRIGGEEERMPVKIFLRTKLEKVKAKKRKLQSFPLFYYHTPKAT